MKPKILQKKEKYIVHINIINKKINKVFQSKWLQVIMPEKIKLEKISEYFYIYIYFISIEIY